MNDSGGQSLGDQSPHSPFDLLFVSAFDLAEPLVSQRESRKGVAVAASNHHIERAIGVGVAIKSRIIHIPLLGLARHWTRLLNPARILQCIAEQRRELSVDALFVQENPPLDVQLVGGQVFSGAISGDARLKIFLYG